MLPRYFYIITQAVKESCKKYISLRYVPRNMLARLNTWLAFYTEKQNTKALLLFWQGAFFPSTMPEFFHVRMSMFSKSNFEQRLNALYDLAKELVELHEANKALENSDYLTTAQFARLVERNPKTISNKASAGFFGKAAKQENGIWLIHKSMVESYE